MGSEEIADLGWFEVLPPEVKIHYDSLQTSAKAVIQNRYHLKQQNYIELKKSDEAIKKNIPSDVWSGQAMQMRAFWKAKYARKTNDPRLAKESLEHLEELSILRRPYNPVWFHDVRVDAALIANDREVFINSYKQLHSLLKGELHKYRQPENDISENKKNELVELINRIHVYLTEPSKVQLENVNQHLQILKDLKREYSEL